MRANHVTSPCAGLWLWAWQGRGRARAGAGAGQARRIRMRIQIFQKKRVVGLRTHSHRATGVPCLSTTIKKIQLEIDRIKWRYWAPCILDFINKKSKIYLRCWHMMLNLPRLLWLVGFPKVKYYPGTRDWFSIVLIFHARFLQFIDLHYIVVEVYSTIITIVEVYDYYQAIKSIIYNIYSKNTSLSHRPCTNGGYCHFVYTYFRFI